METSLAGSTELVVRQGLTSEGPILDTIRHPVAQLGPSHARQRKENILPLSVGFYVSLRGTFSSISRLAIVYTSFTYMGEAFIISLQLLDHNNSSKNIFQLKALLTSDQSFTIFQKEITKKNQAIVLLLTNLLEYTKVCAGYCSRMLHGLGLPMSEPPVYPSAASM